MDFRKTLEERILILDGAMGTMLQSRGLSGGDNELLNLTHPDDIRSIHLEYIAAGADIIETNSFGANAISQAEYGHSEDAPRMAFEAARTARSAADSAPRKVWVAGSVGPTGKSLTLASDADDPTYREIGFDRMVEVYAEQIGALQRGGADLILVETCFDALNAKAAIYAMDVSGCRLPLVVSATVSDRSGRTLTGQTLEAFYHSIEHAPTLCAFGVNCALGASAMTGLVSEIASFSSHPVIFYPNAGIPDELGRYNDSPEEMAAVIGSLAGKGMINIAGGCCGTTPAHISAIAKAVGSLSPRSSGTPSERLSVSGLETVSIDRSLNFTNIGERTNVAGSRKFARLIASGSLDEALGVAADQIEGGAGIIDINMDDPMLDSAAAMRDFIRSINTDPAVAKAAIMIDSSHWETVLEGLKNAQGKCMVNSISLKDGEQEFLRKAREIKKFGAAMVVMAFDEKGQAETFERKIEICARSYRLLTELAGIRPQDIIFDCNILSIGTGLKEHSRFGVDYIEAVRWIKQNLPLALTSGGVSNLSFAFRGNNTVREAMHSAFLYHAIQAGLDMAIVNPQMLQIYDEIEPGLRKAVEDVIFDSDPEATARLTSVASLYGAAKSTEAGSRETLPGNASERLTQAILKGGSHTLEADALEAMESVGSAVGVIEGPLMKGMEKVGELFADGKMFLPQVVKSAKTMRDAVSVLQPYISGSGKAEGKPRFLIATVQGDVHDIGKNITAIVLQCSGFEVTDLGVMVPSGEIIDKAAEIRADIIGVSGLITPSLQRMEELCREMAARGMNTPLFVGGAAATAVHTAVRLAPIYPNVHYGADASASAVMAKRYMLDPEAFIEEEDKEHERLRELRKGASSVKGCKCCRAGKVEAVPSRFFEDIPLTELGHEELLPHFDWKMFDAVCGMKGVGDENIHEEARKIAGSLKAEVCARFFDCHREGEEIVGAGFRLPMLRVGASLADTFPVEGTAQLGMFAVKVDCPEEETDLVCHASRVTFAEAASEWMRVRLSAELPEGTGLIMPAIGYPVCPDHSLKRDVLSRLPEKIGISLTESCAMIPDASICGFVIAGKGVRYPDATHPAKEALEEYALRRGMNEYEKKLFLGHITPEGI